MIADLAFAPGAGIRSGRWMRRAKVPLDAACVVANGVREALRGLLGERCALRLGEPVAPGAAAWRELVADALVFATPGLATDVAFILGRRDARRLLDAAFGEEDGGAAGWSALEHEAVERIAARCASACDVLCVERRGPTRLADAERLPSCAAYFDLRITDPVRATLGVGLLRQLPETPPAAGLGVAGTGPLALTVSAVLGSAEIPAGELLRWQVGDVIALSTKVGDGGELKVAGQRIAGGICGVHRGRAAFAVGTVATRGDAL